MSKTQALVHRFSQTKEYPGLSLKKEITLGDEKLSLCHISLGNHCCLQDIEVKDLSLLNISGINVCALLLLSFCKIFSSVGDSLVHPMV